MTFGLYETGVDSGQPYELYEFTDGSGFWRYTDAEADRVVVNTFTSAPIHRTAFPVGKQEDSGQVEVRLARDLAVVQRFIDLAMPQPMFLTIQRAHVGGSTQATIFRGEIGHVVFEDAEVVLTCTRLQQSLQHRIPRWTFQQTCNNALYDANCKVNKAAFKQTYGAASVSGNTVVLTGGTPKPVDYFLNGLFEWGLFKTMILGHSGNLTVTLMKMPTGLAAAVLAGPTPLVDLYPGCNRVIDGDCLVKFNNVVNFRGFPYIPKRNPFTGLL